MKAEGLYIVTGATGGIGQSIAKALAQAGKEVMLACRNEEKAKALAEEIKKETSNAHIEFSRLELSSLKSVREFAERISASGRKVAALVNNAGVMSRRAVLTEDGYEEDYQVNFISPVLLTYLLLPQMENGGMVVYTTSVTRKWCSIPKEFPDERHFSQLGTYSRSKRALTMYAVHIAEELKGRGVRVNCADPGVVDTTMISMGRWYDPLADIFFRPFISTREKGASSVINALESEETGKVFHHNRVKPAYKGMRTMKNYNRVIETVLKK